MRLMKASRFSPAACAIVALMTLGCQTPLRAFDNNEAGSTSEIQTSDVRVRVRAGATSPMLVGLSGKGAAGIGWNNDAEEALPSSVEIDGKPVPLRWKLKSTSHPPDGRQLNYVYESSEPHLRATWMWEARATYGPLEHRVQIENLGSSELWLPMVDSLRLNWRDVTQTGLKNFYTEKGANTPSPQGTHLEDIADGYAWTGTSSTYGHPIEGEPREIIPAEFVFDAVSQAGWYAGIEFSGRTRISLARKGASLESILGLNPEPGPYKTRLSPHATFDSPAVFLGAFSGGPDGAGNQLRPWVRSVLTNPEAWKDPKYPLMVNNSWGSGMQVDEALALRMIGESKELGLEMFHIDAGWFRGVGDWYPDPRRSFPTAWPSLPMRPIARACASASGSIGRRPRWTPSQARLTYTTPRYSDWLMADVKPDWKPEEFKGQTIDIGVPAAHAYAAKEVKRIVNDYHLDMLEHDGYLVAEGCTRTDHPHAPPIQSSMKQHHDSGFDFFLASNSTDVSYHAVRAYYDIYAQLRKEHPGILLEICNDGGRMVDFGSAAHGDYFSITDTYDPLSNRRAFFDTSYVLPAAMLESYVEKWPVPTMANFLYMLRSGMMGWTTIMLDTSIWTPQQHEAAKKAFDLYKLQLRPLIRDANLYHVSDRPDGVHWDAMQYWDPQRKSGVVFAFRGSVQNENEHPFVLAGLDPRARYSLHFEDGSSPDRDLPGSELMSTGLTVTLKEPLSSELVFVREAAKP